MQIGIIRETKIPQDSRVCLPPVHCKAILDAHPNVSILVQPSDIRCYSDIEYQELGIQVQEDISACDILIGVKEVKMEALIPNKTYFFFSHTIKKQAHNKKLLQAVLAKKIHLVDYETLTDREGKRVIAFGKWAGIVGAHNGIRTWGKRMQRFNLKAMHACFDFAEATSYYPSLDLQGLKIVLTGTGRVSSGSAQVLDAMNIQKLAVNDFLEYEGNEAVYCMLETNEMFAKGPDKVFDAGFYRDPSTYESIMLPYLCKANLLINGIYWDSRCPALFSLEDLNHPNFTVEVIADITCDIAPDASIPTTLKASTIAEPFFGYDKKLHQEVAPFQVHTIDMMSIDNLPNELPRDASADFGSQFLEHVLPELFNNQIDMIHRASITTSEGVLNEPYLYLSDYVFDTIKK